ncbi:MULTISPECIES: branched-chain amino acid ABC transporter permease [unclassified Haladaptatus]|uniref:branched-chain amino acid ABC transporter permease n=1 Tax=unclassified Haladaptatus TaxID=2622732 RepID=UPI00209BF84C|nr:MULTISPECIES: branched-chain amino acid ABC transporter permease [unclassified Haladaptatus]MCO8245673.1 branched-chain amino acid ABC transporter permease [Haladaptatus sp. AB643]MCO8255501.1 branched-chain amino acid ABC transporter permease [Haladaptatus sp. AB618]
MSEDVERSYPTDLVSLAPRYKLGLLALVLLALSPFWLRLLLGEGQGLLAVITLTTALFFAMFAMSWDAVSGYTGQISFGHALFFTVGGYGSALLNLELGVPPIAAVLLGTLLAAVAGILIGVPALRLEGPYLSLVTLVAPLILLQLFIVFSGVFGGELGLPSPDPLVSVSGFTGQTMADFYVALIVFVFILAVLLAVTRSDAGSVFTAIREDEQTVAAAGINPAKFKIFAFVLSAAVGGLAGAVFVHTVGKPQPSQLLVMSVSVEVIIASIVGGMGTITGAAIGGLFFSLFREWLSGVSTVVPLLNVQVASLDLLLFSLITLCLLFFLPGGVLRWGIERARNVVGDEPNPVADGGQTPFERTLDAYRDALDTFGSLGGEDRER